MTNKAESFISLLKRKASLSGNKIFGRFEGAPISFSDLDCMSDAFACMLRRRGIVKGARVAVMLRNSPTAIAVIFGLAKAGVVWVPINPGLQGNGLKYVLEHSDPSLLIVEADLLGAVHDCGACLPAISTHGATGDLADALAPGPAFDEIEPVPQDCLAIMYTSGTTGPPKGVLVSHGMLRFAADAVRLVSGAADGDTMFVWEPFFHIGGAQLLVLPLISKITLAMVKTFSASRFWSQVRAEQATHIHYLGGVLQALLKQPESTLDRDHQVRIAWGGGCPIEIWQPWADRFGVAIRECYGMTETSSIATYNDKGIVGAIGVAVPWFEVAILDAYGQVQPPGTLGTIAVRDRAGGALFAGYFKAEHQRDAMFQRGYFLTGDLGIRNAAGHLFYKGRATDSVRHKGENVSAWEVESVAEQHDAIEASAMVGVAADIGEQDIKLFVKPKPGRKIDPRELSRWLSQRIAPYQNPRYIAIVSDFERTPTERIVKHKLSKALDDCWDRLSDGGITA